MDRICTWFKDFEIVKRCQLIIYKYHISELLCDRTTINIINFDEHWAWWKTRHIGDFLSVPKIKTAANYLRSCNCQYRRQLTKLKKWKMLMICQISISIFYKLTVFEKSRKNETAFFTQSIYSKTIVKIIKFIAFTSRQDAQLKENENIFC